MRVLVACEYSGVVREAFGRRGHEVTSCDLLPTDLPTTENTQHVEGDVSDLLREHWDLVIAHPPCTYLTASGNRWFYHPDDKHLPVAERRPHPKHPNRRKLQTEALEFLVRLYFAGDRCAVENPVGAASSLFRKPDQVIQPWQFGHKASKATCLWLRGLPPLQPTDVVDRDDVWISPSGKRMGRWAYEMASQWG